MSVSYDNPEGVFLPSSFSQLITVEDEALLIMSGQVAFDEQGNLVGEGDLRAQAVQVFENIETILASAKLDFVQSLRPKIFPKNFVTRVNI